MEERINEVWGGGRREVINGRGVGKESEESGL